LPVSAGEQAWKPLRICTGRFGVEVGPGAASSGAGGGAGLECPLRLGLVDVGASRWTSDDDGVLRRTKSRGRAMEWLQSLARRRPPSAPGGALLVCLSRGGAHGGAELHARCETNERADDRNKVTRNAMLAFFLTQTRRGRLHACASLSTAASGACRPSFQRGWMRRTRPRRAEGPPQGSRSTVTSPRRPYAGSACTRHVDGLRTKDARTSDTSRAAPRRPGSVLISCTRVQNCQPSKRDNEVENLQT
jgi:hypothetical protein